MRIVVYKLIVGGSVKCIAETEKEIQSWVDSGGLETICGRVDYVIISEEMNLPTITGKLFVDKNDDRGLGSYFDIRHLSVGQWHLMSVRWGLASGWCGMFGWRCEAGMRRT